MLFGEKLRQLRLAAGLTQTELAAKIGVSPRTCQNYELCRMYPKKTEIYRVIASFFNVEISYLLADEDLYVLKAEEKGGLRSKKDVQALMAEVGGLFAGGELTEADKDNVMRTINDLYWKAKEYNRKYASRQSRSGQENVRS
jgi:transcriptional regulator with XRE-family HTH domain